MGYIDIYPHTYRERYGLFPTHMIGHRRLIYSQIIEEIHQTTALEHNEEIHQTTALTLLIAELPDESLKLV